MVVVCGLVGYGCWLSKARKQIFWAFHGFLYPAGAMTTLGRGPRVQLLGRSSFPDYPRLVDLGHLRKLAKHCLEWASKQPSSKILASSSCMSSCPRSLQWRTVTWKCKLNKPLRVLITFGQRVLSLQQSRSRTKGIRACFVRRCLSQTNEASFRPFYAVLDQERNSVIITANFLKNSRVVGQWWRVP